MSTAWPCWPCHLVGPWFALVASGAQEPAPARPPANRAGSVAVFQFPQRIERLHEPTDGRLHVKQRLLCMLRGALITEPVTGAPQLTLTTGSRQYLVSHDAPAQQALITEALHLLADNQGQRARLHCSLLTLPMEQAKTLGLIPGVTQPCDDAGTAFARGAIGNGGTVRNLPELVVERLQPFLGEPKATPATKDSVLRLRGEMLPLSRTEIVVDHELVRGDLPAGKPQAPMAAVLRTVLRLRAGQTAVTMAGEGDASATVLIVRCIEITSPLPPSEAKR